MCGHCIADLCLCCHICKMQFSHDVAHLYLPLEVVDRTHRRSLFCGSTTESLGVHHNNPEIQHGLLNMQKN